MLQLLRNEKFNRFGWEFFPPIAAIVLLGVLSFVSLRNIRDSEVATINANRSLTNLQLLFRDLLNAEPGQRGYLLTGDLKHLEPYFAAKSSYQRRIEEIRGLKDDAVALSMIRQIDALSSIRFKQLDEAVSLRSEATSEEAKALFKSDVDEATMEDIREYIVAAESLIHSKVRDSDELATNAYVNAVVAFATALIMTLAASVWSLFRVDRELQRRRISEQIVRHRAGQLQAFADIVARIFSARDVESIIGVALNEFRQLIGSREALLQIKEPGHVRYERGIVATGVQNPSHEYLDSVFSLVERLSKGEATFFRIRAQILANESVMSDPAWTICGDAMDGVLSAPLKNATRLEIGRIVWMSKFGEEFTANDCLLAAQLAYAVSVAIENAKLTSLMEEEARRKDEFLAMLGHELRNPLAGVLTGSEALILLDADDKDANSLKESILRQSKMMNRIVDDLLDVSRIGRGRVSLALAPLDIFRIVTEMVDDFRRAHPARSFVIDASPDVQPSMILGDRARISQSFSNLVHNACKFSPPDSEVTLRMRRGGLNQSIVQVDVIDRGDGLSAEEQRLVFNLFHQTRATIDRSQGGLGIGLTLARSLIEMHGGALTLSSPGHGLGCTFTICLPLNPLVPVATEVIVPSSQRDTITDSRKTRKSRVLVIDDRADAILPIRVLLTREGHEVFEAHDGATGIEIAIELIPDVIFCDIGLPGKYNGYDVVRALRQNSTLRDTYIIALSGYSQPADRQRAAEAGFDLHLAKPIDGSRLRELLNRQPRFGPPHAERIIESISSVR